jgi:hypothetical protein
VRRTRGWRATWRPESEDFWVERRGFCVSTAMMNNQHPRGVVATDASFEIFGAWRSFEVFDTWRRRGCLNEKSVDWGEFGELQFIDRNDHLHSFGSLVALSPPHLSLHSFSLPFSFTQVPTQLVASQCSIAIIDSMSAMSVLSISTVCHRGLVV